MGIISSTLGYYLTRTDDPDPVTGLTSRDIYVLQSSWAPVKKDLTGNGVALLLLYFDKYPEEIKYFPFKDLPKEELKTSKKFHAHCNSVMVAIDSFVFNVKDAELLVNLLEKIGTSHHRRNIKVESFENLKKTVVELFSTFMSKEQVDVWKKFLNVGFGVIAKSL